MQAYDDRPISMYDNLNVSSAGGGTAQAPHKNSLQMTASSPNTTNGAAAATHSPYSDIQFQFERQNNAQPTTTTNTTTNSPHLLPNGRTVNQLHSTTTTSPNTPYYSTPFKTAKSPTNPLPITPTITTTPAPIPLSATISHNNNNNINNNNGSHSGSSNYSSPQRPLSQHSNSELNETGQSIAAVKAALNDAKSKFFGLNGYASDSVDSPQVPISQPQPTAAASSPKYQNIPENSAIFRQHQQQQQQPPELPPKPIANNNNNNNSPSPMSGRNSTDPQNSYSSSMPVPSGSQNAPNSPSTSKLLPNATYKAIPLNDIDTAQPSQAVYMTTTVPQNIKVAKIAGRHTPTRNSLRHSRMLVVNNKNYQAVQRPNPLNFKHPTWARCLLILQTILGLMLLGLALWIVMLAPNSSIQDNPYWSGLALILSGILGLVLIRYQRIKRDKVRENCFLFLRADSYVMSLLALLLCTIALLFASLHYARLTAPNTKCVSTNILEIHGSCACTFNAVETVPPPPAANMTALEKVENTANSEETKNKSYILEYRDLSCMELHGEWTYILGLSLILNLLGCLVSLAYIVFLACCRIKSTVYSSVHTSTF